MKIAELEIIMNDYISSSNSFPIEKEIFDAENGRANYNQIINKNVKPKSFGIYIWVNPKNEKIIYIGMAGKIKNEGICCEHHLQKRLTATRGKDKITKRDILTNDYVKYNMEKENIDKLDFYIYYTKTGEPASYVEALLLYKYFKKNNQLPLLNNAF